MSDTSYPDLAGRRVVVTGAASGIGAATAALLHRLRVEVITLDRAEPDPAVVAEHLPCDLTEPRSIDAALERIDGQIHGLVNVAGLPGSKPAAAVFAVNFLAVRHLTNALAARIQRGGSIVQIASTAGAYWRERGPLLQAALDACASFEDGAAWFSQQEMDGTATYDFSKELVVVDALKAAAEMRLRLGVRLNVVSPGAVETPILGDFYETMDGALLARMRDAVGGTNAEPSQIAPVVAFLLSDAAGWISGADIWVDGGAEAGVATGVIT